MHQARTFIDVPWRHQGRSRRGIDCVGLPIVSGRLAGFDTPDMRGYSRHPSGSMMRRLLRQHCDPVAFADLVVGDLLHLLFGEQPQHIAIVSGTDPLTIVHADSQVGRVVEHPLGEAWRYRIRGCYRVRQP